MKRAAYGGSLFVLLLGSVAACSSQSTGADSGSTSSDGGMQQTQDATDPPDEGPPPCEYPPGPYGYVVGRTVPANIGWECYAPGESQPKMVYAKDFYDCDGRHGIHAVLFDESALWCGPCQQEANDMPAYLQSTAKPNGIAMVTLIVQDNAMNVANITHAASWRSQYKLQDMWVCADPGWFFAKTQGTNSLPQNVIVDPRTMKITKITEGYAGMIEPALLQLAQKNKPQ